MAGKSANSHGRMHALDGLRATMMLLGLVLHSACSYMTVDIGEAWPYHDTANTMVADLTVLLIHVFRMPIFFALAGFFAAMLYQRRGAGGFLSNRFQRIGIPFVVGLIVLYPIIYSGFAFANIARDTSLDNAWTSVVALAATSVMYVPSATSHLWFLYDLLYLYVGAVVMAAVCQRTPTAWRSAVVGAFGALLRRPVLRVVIPGIVTALTLAPMGGAIATPLHFVPNLAVLLAYGVFFGFGWLLYDRRDALSSFDRLAWTQTIGAVILFFAVRFGVPSSFGANYGLALALAVRCLTSGIVVWMLFYGLTGLFLRYLDKPSATVRYIVDGSYWVYLVHLPFITWILGPLAGADLSVWLKWAIVLASTTVFGFVTYDLFARASFIGLVLNGHRYPRGLPAGASLEVAPSKAS